MANAKDIFALEATRGYIFKNKDLLQNALTHSTYANESKVKVASNERLEFLGDAVLQIYISDHLYHTYPDCAEGELTKMRQFLVCEKTLAEAAQGISLGSYMRFGKGEGKDGPSKPSVLADAFEALLAAVYLDSQKDSTARDLLIRLLSDKIKQAAFAHMDYKTRLQQFVQQAGNEQLSYVTVSESGPPHARIFTVEAKIDSNTMGCGTGHTKREAEQNAAREALRWFKANLD